MLDADSETFVMHAAIREREKMVIDPDKKAQIEVQSGAQSKVQVKTLLFDKAPTEVPAEYSIYSDVFSAKNAAKLPENTKMNEHAIKLEEDKQPPFGSIYSLGLVELKTLKTYIETNMANDFICLSKSPAGAFILFDQKPDGSFRLCVDYWGLNNITIKNQYLLPLISESLDRFCQAKWFTQLDLTNAYHWMRICEGDEWKTAFRTRYGHFKYQVMPFGFSNAPATFQGYVNKILAEKLDIFIIVYLDDILIYTEDLSQPHVEVVRWVLDQLRKYLLFANLKKCRFHQDEVCFLGYVVSSKGISMEAERIEVVRKWPEPKSVWDIQVFLGFANFYRQFIQGFSRIAAPLTSMLKTTAPPKKLTLKEVGDGEGGDGIDDGSVEIAKKSRKSKGQKTSKSQKSSKSGKSKGEKSKKSLKSGNSPNFDAKNSGPSFLTPKARSAFNRT